MSKKIRTSREKLTNELENLGFDVVNSQSNFLFASPPDGNAEEMFKALREANIIVRYFPGEKTGKYLRITIGTEKQLERLVNFLKQY